MVYVRTVKTASGATAVQIVYSNRRGARRMKHLGSAHDEQELEALLAAAGQQLADSQQELDLGLEVAAAAGPGPPQIVSITDGAVVGRAEQRLRPLGFDRACGCQKPCTPHATC